MRSLFLILCILNLEAFAAKDLEEKLKQARKIDTSKKKIKENSNKGIFKKLSLKEASKKHTVNKKKFCLGVDNEKMSIGTKWTFTCNTDPNTKENVWARDCILGKDGNAKWSKDYTEYDPEGC